MERRNKLIRTLERRIAEQEWDRCSDLYFQVTYSLPAPLQIGLAGFAVNGYLPIFERKWPAVQWPRQLLGDVDRWISQHGRSLPDEPADADPADAAFILSFDGILSAAMYAQDPFTLTASASAAVNAAINAQQTNVWIADDPEAVELWKRQEYVLGRDVLENAASVAVAAREWKRVADCLNEKQVWSYPDQVSEEEVEKALARWREIEKLFTVPKT